MSIVIAVRGGLVHCKRQGTVARSAHRDGAGAARSLAGRQGIRGDRERNMKTVTGSHAGIGIGRVGDKSQGWEVLVLGNPGTGGTAKCTQKEGNKEV